MTCGPAVTSARISADIRQAHRCESAFHDRGTFVMCRLKCKDSQVKQFSSLRARLVGTVFLAITPAALLLWAAHLPWSGFIVGLIALGAAWLGGERFILRQVRLLTQAA